MNISSIVILINPANEEEVIDQLKSENLCEFQLSSGDGKLIATIEAEGVEQELAALKSIKQIPGVVSAEMVYSYSENELDKERDKLNSAKDMPEWLNKDVDAREIKYHGDLRRKL